MANSDELIIDLTGYKDRVGSRVIPGRYKVRVDDAEQDKTKNGDPMINVFLSIVGGEFEGSTVVDRLLPAHTKAQFRLVGFMQAIGLQTPRKRIRINLAQWRGKLLEVDIEDGEPYNNRVKSEIRGYYRIERAAAADDLLADGLAEFAPGGSYGPSDADRADIEQMKGEVAASSARARGELPPDDLLPDDQLAAEREVAQAPEDDGEIYAPIDLETLDLE